MRRPGNSRIAHCITGSLFALLLAGPALAQTGGEQSSTGSISSGGAELQTGAGHLRFVPPDQQNQAGAQGEASYSTPPATTPPSEQAPPTARLRTVVGTLSLRGVQPGRTTLDQVRSLWGEPARVNDADPANIIFEYPSPPFAAAKVSFAGGRVARIALTLNEARPVAEIAAALEISDIPNVVIPNEEGIPLGVSFPERGVLLSVAGDNPNAVTQAVVEPVSFHAFLLRAEANWRDDYTSALADLATVMEMDANQPQAHWLRAEILHALGRSEEALNSAREALRLAPQTPEYMLTEAAILIHQGHNGLANDLAEQTVRATDGLEELKAQALVFQGDLLRDAGAEGSSQAMNLHMTAIEAAKTLINDRRMAVRRAAREAYLDAHLSVAEDIATGAWRNQIEVTEQWLSRAMTLAESAEESRAPEQKFRVACQAMRIIARMPAPPDPESWAKLALTTGRQLMATTPDSLRRQRISWQLGAAMSAGVKVHRQRGEGVDALQLAELANRYISAAGPDRGRGGREALQLGLFQFQAGSVEALINKDHVAAAGWFAKARDSFALAPRHLIEQMDGEFGQILVSMAVSYWETGETQPAMELMTQGAGFMEMAVNGGRLDSQTLGVPYFNLSAMHRYLGKEPEAAKYDELARGVGAGTVNR